MLSGIVQCLESRNLSKNINSAGTGMNQNSGARILRALSIPHYLKILYNFDFEIIRRRGEKSTLEGRRVVYSISLLMDYLLSGTPAERDRKVTGNIN